ncbi:hypothetical protein IFM89_020553 [Coptis chinensis]|uniref:PLAT domain-containing protein n=1 Tax=Coptis chinensis TaxID=261450 RepID=A0A835HIU4_9MAGN|nr:hypothetical protein IFM89_020553 [Coptis chinensis]
MAKFFIDSNFGIPSAIAVTNKHQKEFFLESIVIEGLVCEPVHFSCNSWVQSRKDHLGKRVFFSNKKTGVEKPLPMYVPRDEAFEESKQDTFAAGG